MKAVLDVMSDLEVAGACFHVEVMANRPTVYKLTCRQPDWCKKPPLAWVQTMARFNTARYVWSDLAFPTVDPSTGKPLSAVQYLKFKQVH